MMIFVMLALKNVAGYGFFGGGVRILRFKERGFEKTQPSVGFRQSREAGRQTHAVYASLSPETSLFVLRFDYLSFACDSFRACGILPLLFPAGSNFYRQIIALRFASFAKVYLFCIRNHAPFCFPSMMPFRGRRPLIHVVTA
ncbi:hypothetical protein [Acanthopleuribacter pedis]|uniref:Uncharacterized protein n=1 Tax=Acanthopleuribacter pedis TaxID=442870 RepID=A0A8J7U795_9BACT|nr:hypothetical protein [Acanthopleuribacter pedis]MBO1321171.1 hypothetical protein [Acanthopleuribacter pedis]